MIDFKKLIQPSFIFNYQPQTFTFFWYSVIIFSAMVLSAVTVAIFLKTQGKPYLEKLKSSIFSLLLWTGGFGLALTFFHWQAIPYLSMRFLFEILFLVFIVWLIFILKYLIFNFKKEKQDFNQSQRFEKYMPRAQSRSLPKK